ncbi:hypothetical protein LCGC14_2869870, partial [marine sediment metagenome]
FLSNELSNSKIELLESAKDKKEILEIAKARGINLKNNRDLSGFKSVYTIANVKDGNGQRLPKAKLLKALPTIIGKPVNINHDRRYVVGSYIDYKFVKKTGQVITYGVFYKSNFGQEWAAAKQYLSEGSLGMSSEIWCPEKNTKKLEDGSFELLEMELAGGALVYPPERPAVKGADVLAIARKKMDENSDVDLLYASKYKDGDLLYAGATTDVAEKVEAPVEKEVVTVEKPTIIDSKIKCGHCSEEFVPTELGMIKCPKCFAIVDKAGKMIYPPQIFDFHINCKHCHVSNWLKTKAGDESIEVRCMTCSREYELIFAKVKEKSVISDMCLFVYATAKNCDQCGHSNQITGISGVMSRSITCKKCGLEFDIDLEKDDAKRIIKSVKEIIKSKDIA